MIGLKPYESKYSIGPDLGTYNANQCSPGVSDFPVLMMNPPGPFKYLIFNTSIGITPLNIFFVYLSLV